jgi:hypothetical protein
MGKIIFLGRIVTNQNYIHQDINACYFSFHNLLYSSLISKILKIKIHKTVILSVVLYWRKI